MNDTQIFSSFSFNVGLHSPPQGARTSFRSVSILSQDSRTDENTPMRYEVGEEVSRVCRSTAEERGEDCSAPVENSLRAWTYKVMDQFVEKFAWSSSVFLTIVGQVFC